MKTLQGHEVISVNLFLLKRRVVKNAIFEDHFPVTSRRKEVKCGT
jgi:hypothetical protein